MMKTFQPPPKGDGKQRLPFGRMLCKPGAVREREGGVEEGGLDKFLGMGGRHKMVARGRKGMPKRMDLWRSASIIQSSSEQAHKSQSHTGMYCFSAIQVVGSSSNIIEQGYHP
jgi:hypothetical protein